MSMGEFRQAHRDVSTASATPAIPVDPRHRRPRHGALIGWAAPFLAVLVVGVLLLGTVGSHPSAAPGASAPAGATTPPFSTTSVPTREITGPSNVGGASCPNASRSSGAPPAVASDHPSGTGPSPQFNTQVQPYTILTGPYDYVAGGAALRDQGYGQIDLTWPGGTTSNLVAAYMIWSILNDTVPPTNATVNGNSVTGTWTAYATPSPCWAPTYIYTFIAEVTADVVNGVNNLTGFPSGITTGADPWASAQTAPMDEGASLIAIYDSGTSIIHQVSVMTGALPVSGVGPTVTLNFSAANASAAQTTYIVADGQFYGNSATWNGTVIDGNAFPGDDPHETPTVWSYGNLSDTHTFDVNVTPGATNVTAQVSTAGSDCVNWVGQVLSVEVPALPGPYNVTFEEQGLASGTPWNVTTNGNLTTSVAASGPTAVSYLLGNGTYSYSVGQVPGYVAQPTSGTVWVAGGPQLVRVIFHQEVYLLTFNETGLPAGNTWDVTLINTTQSVDLYSAMTTPTGITFTVANGSYNYTPSQYGLYHAVPTNGTVTVAGSAVTVNVVWEPPPLYNVTFIEQNLTAGTVWGGGVDTNWVDSYNTTTAISFSLELPNATFGVDGVYPRTVVGYSTATYVPFGVSGGPTTVYVNYSLNYAVIFNSTGLPSGTSWSGYLVSSAGSVYGYTDNNTIYWSEANGSYTFVVDAPWAYVANPASGSLAVAGAAVTVYIVFSLAPTYTITINETGLAVGTLWTVEVTLPNDTEISQSSSSSSLVLNEPNGTYYIVPAAVGYTPSPPYFYGYVYGANVYEPVAFSQVYAVVFTEVGLPSDTYWEVYFDYSYAYSYGTNLTVWVPNGTFDFDVYGGDGFTATPEYGTITISGAGAAQTIVFSSSTEPVYSVTFNAVGLAAGTNWSVAVDYYSEYTTGSSLVFWETNGTFPFVVSGGGTSTPNPSSGDVTISGANVTQTITWGTSTLAYYAVTFTESGLPSGATWYVNVSGQTPLEATVSGSTGTTLSLSLANGSYSYQVATDEAGWTTPTPGPFSVAGAPLGVSVPFTSSSVAQYEVTLTETSLPSGASWYVNISGEPGLSTTVSTDAGTTLAISLPNGTYTFTASSGDKGWTTTAGPGFTVAGAPVSESVPFTHSTTTPASYVVTFAESGLPSGASWYVNITGEPSLSSTVSSSGSNQVVISLENGSYSYSVATGLKNWTAPGASGFQVAGADRQISLAFTGPSTTTPPPTSSGSSNGLPLLWIGIGALIGFLALLIFFLAYRRRRKENPPPPQTPPGPGSGNSPP